MSQKLDEKIKETTEVVVFAVGLAQAIEKATADGWQWTDVLSMLPPMTKLPAAIEGIDSVPDEIAVMDDESRLELSAEIAKLGFDDKGAEAITEQSLRTGIELARLIVLVRDEREVKEYLGDPNEKIDDEEY